jgi:hypothetical protein
MLEAQFQATVIQIARVNNWMVFHPAKIQGRDGAWRTALAGNKGWPDLALAHKDRGFILAELKSDTGKLSFEQQLWIQHLAPWAECYVWKPKDLDSIAERLAKTPVNNVLKLVKD